MIQVGATKFARMIENTQATSFTALQCTQFSSKTVQHLMIMISIVVLGMMTYVQLI